MFFLAQVEPDFRFGAKSISTSYTIAEPIFTTRHEVRGENSTNSEITTSTARRFEINKYIDSPDSPAKVADFSSFPSEK